MLYDPPLLIVVNFWVSSGIVTIFYQDKSIYEGPFISDDWLDDMGRVNPEGRHSNHYGVFKLEDGRVFEGPLVDNHLDINNLQGYYRVTFPNGMYLLFVAL